MKRASHKKNRRRIMPILTAVCGVLFMFTVVRAQSTGSSKKLLPNLPLAPLSNVLTPGVPGLSNYVVNQTAAIQLGKALFWDMQAGSDGIQACASCHFNAGADSRAINSVSPGLKISDPITFAPNPDTSFQLGVMSGGVVYPNYKLHAGTAAAGYHDGDFPLHKVDATGVTVSDVNDVISSQGVYPTVFNGITPGSSVDMESSIPDSTFSYPDPRSTDPSVRMNTRRVPPRNTPSNINAVFNYRNFWDGRAQNICNGANPFGDRDTTSHLYAASSQSATPVATLVRLQNSALCSQALGPALSSFEMSADGRDFRMLGRKLLSVTALGGSVTPLGYQVVSTNDSVLGAIAGAKGLNTTYAALIQKAFSPQWWQSRLQVCIASDHSESWIDPKLKQTCPAGSQQFSQMEYNFSLFWGLAIQMYESTLRADQTPLDKYLAAQSVYLIQANNVSNSFTFALNGGKKGIVPYSVSVQAFNPNLDTSDQDVYAFDNGFGGIVGVGVVSGTVNYTTGQMSILFELPPSTAFATKVAYSVGSTPLSTAQLRGLQIFQTKGRCVVCHGGAELTNASVTNVVQRPVERMVMGDLNIRVYDGGFYHIGARPAWEDIGLGGGDGITGAPLAQTLLDESQVCNNTAQFMIPGRPGDGITASPLNCGDPVNNIGSMKTPGLRNISLTAPYFHNGGQLTLEQVVEFYNRGGDFGASELDVLDQRHIQDGTTDTRGDIQNGASRYLDPNIQLLGLRADEQADLVDFLRNGLLDSRTYLQQAPFDHPSLYVPNGNQVDGNGYPLPDPNHPGQALDQYMTIPAVGKGGGTPLPTFLDNLAKP